MIRRMSNVSDRIGQEERVKLVNEFTRELKNSGYTRRRAREIVVCGLLGVEGKKLRRARQGQKFYRKGKSTLTERTKKKLIGKTAWFKNKPEDKEEDVQKRKEASRDRDSLKDSRNTSKNIEPKAVLYVT